MDGFLNKLHSVLDQCLMAEALKEPEFKVHIYHEPAPDPTAEFREDIEYTRKKLSEALRVPAEFIQNTHSACPIYWFEPKYETQPFELRFEPLKPMELFKK